MQPTSERQEFNLVIVGGGMTGLALAAGLAQAPLRIALIEIEPFEPIWQPEQLEIRVSALSQASCQLLEKLGAWSFMQALRVSPYQSMCVWDGEGTAEVRFDAQEAGVAHLGYLVENKVTQLGLLQALKEQENLTWFRGLEPTALSEPLNALGQRQLALNNAQILQADLVVAADGASSKLRQWGGFATREWDYQHHALVTSVRTQKPHAHTAWQRFSAAGPLAFLPLNRGGDCHWCSIVWSTHPKRVTELMQLDEQAFNQRLTQAFEGRLGQVLCSETRAAYPLRQRHATDYVRPGLALVGDAAHTIHPLAGQGVNLGFLDIQALLAIIANQANQGYPIGRLAALQGYQLQRKTENLTMMAAMEGFKRLFAQQAPAWVIARNLGMKWVNQQPSIKRQLIVHALGLPLAIKA